MPTATPEQVRAGLAVLTTAATADVQTVVASAETPPEIRAALFAAVPLIVGDYADGAASLALDWYDDLRDAAHATRPFTARPVAVVREDQLATTVAWATEALYHLEQKLTRGLDRDAEQLLAQATSEAMTRLLPEIQKEVASGFRSTIVENADDDPAAVGWRRFTTGAESCKFCQMLADKGAVYVESTARFAAHTDCDCLAGPSFDPAAPKASVMQYVASRKNRTPEQQAALRDYLNEHFPDAPG